MHSVTSNAVAGALSRKLFKSGRTLIGNGYYEIYTAGKTVELYIWGVSLSSGSEGNLIILDSAIKPVYSFFILGQNGSGSHHFGTSVLAFTNTDSVYVYAYDNYNYLRLHTTWLIA